MFVAWVTASSISRGECCATIKSAIVRRNENFNMDQILSLQKTARKVAHDSLNTLLFVYGTLRRGFANHEAYLADAVFMGDAVTEEGFALFVEDFPYLVKRPKVSRIVGELYRVDGPTLKDIDCLEGHPDNYRREQIQVVTDLGVHHWAWTYFYPEPRGRLLMSGDYDGSDTA
jgi:gamma-glutamylaminecyclotransferase